MAISANKLIYDVVEIASSGGTPSEFVVSNEQILYWIEQTRAMLIAQSLNKRDDVNDSWIQWINCLELEQVDSSLCCDVSSDCVLLRSVQRIPSTVDTWKDNWIISVATMDGSPISKSNNVRNKYKAYNKWTKNERSWFLKDDYLYITNDVFLEKVSLAGIFEFPSDLQSFNTCEGQSCFDLDGDFPVSVSMASAITDIILKTKINPFFSYPNDNSNNSNGLTPKQNIDNKQSQ